MNYNSKTLLDVKFSKNVKGYDALEVDFLPKHKKQLEK